MKRTALVICLVICLVVFTYGKNLYDLGKQNQTVNEINFTITHDRAEYESNKVIIKDQLTTGSALMAFSVTLALGATLLVAFLLDRGEKKRDNAEKKRDRMITTIFLLYTTETKFSPISTNKILPPTEIEVQEAIPKTEPPQERLECPECLKPVVFVESKRCYYCRYCKNWILPPDEMLPKILNILEFKRK